jgi:hypothetical protein
MILGAFRALKLTEVFSEFKNIKERGYGFQMMLSVLILMIIHSEKTVYSYLSGIYGAGTGMDKDVFYR